MLEHMTRENLSFFIKKHEIIIILAHRKIENKLAKDE
jgi:hypothetical protein